MALHLETGLHVPRQKETNYIKSGSSARRSENTAGSAGRAVRALRGTLRLAQDELMIIFVWMPILLNKKQNCKIDPSFSAYIAPANT